MSTPHPMERLINLMSGMVSAGAEDAMRLATSLRDGRVDLNEVQDWYEKRRDQSMGMMRELGDEIQTLQKQGLGRYVSVGRRQLERGDDALRRAASRSRRRSTRRASARRSARHVARRSARRTVRRQIRRTLRRVSRGTHRARVRSHSRSRTAARH